MFPINFNIEHLQLEFFTNIGDDERDLSSVQTTHITDKLLAQVHKVFALIMNSPFKCAYKLMLSRELTSIFTGAKNQSWNCRISGKSHVNILPMLLLLAPPYADKSISTRMLIRTHLLSSLRENWVHHIIHSVDDVFVYNLSRLREWVVSIMSVVISMHYLPFIKFLRRHPHSHCASVQHRMQVDFAFYLLLVQREAERVRSENTNQSERVRNVDEILVVGRT